MCKTTKGRPVRTIHTCTHQFKRACIKCKKYIHTDMCIHAYTCIKLNGKGTLSTLTPAAIHTGLFVCIHSHTVKQAYAWRVSTLTCACKDCVGKCLQYTGRYTYMHTLYIHTYMSVNVYITQVGTHTCIYHTYIHVNKCIQYTSRYTYMHTSYIHHTYIHKCK